MDWHSQLPGKKRRQWQRAFGRNGAIERGDDATNRLRSHRMVAAAKKQRWGRSVPRDPVCNTAEQQATTTAGTLGRHDDEIGVGSIIDDAFGGPTERDASLERALRRTESRRNLLEILGRRLRLWGFLGTDTELPDALSGKCACPIQRGLGAF